ncbi:MAG TPA: class I SAM-dependent methyltransferase [Candidatus Limnocylindrales bacterium]
MTVEKGYELIDCGDGRRLERFGERIVDRPAPAAVDPRRAPDERWLAAELRFETGRGWQGDADAPWVIDLDGLRLELRQGANGQLGVYPEHAMFWPWLRNVIGDRPDASVLNLFASTGATTLAVARAGARVAHVDGSRGAVARARHNAAASGLAHRPIRWIVDDALAFTRREGRRGRRYDGIVLDPPSYGHAARGATWTIDRGLGSLLEAVAAVAADDVFVLLTAHTSGVRPGDLADALHDVFGAVPDLVAEAVELTASSGAVLPAGVAARMIRS